MSDDGKLFIEKLSDLVVFIAHCTLQTNLTTLTLEGRRRGHVVAGGTLWYIVHVYIYNYIYVSRLDTLGTEASAFTIIILS